MCSRRIMILGGSGRLGYALTKYAMGAGYDVISCGLTSGIYTFDITKEEQLHEYVTIYDPDVVINAAGMVDLDTCDARPSDAMAVNGTAVYDISQLCSSSRLVQISSNYVYKTCLDPKFDSEEVLGVPSTVYGMSKLVGEHAAMMCSNSLVIRTSALLGGSGKRRSFAEAILRNAERGCTEIPVIEGARCNPTNVHVLAAIVVNYATTDVTGIRHICGQPCSYRDYARTVLDQFGYAHVKITSYIESGVPRPSVPLQPSCATWGVEEQVRLWREEKLNEEGK